MVTMIMAVFAGDPLTLWGKQTAGWGHSVNAKTEGNTLVLKKSAEIVKVSGDAKVYCIWAKATPQNPTAKSVLCGGKGYENIKGKVLPAGSYTVLPGLEGKKSAKVTITFKEK